MDMISLIVMVLGIASITLAIVAIAVSFVNRRRSQDNYEKTLEALTEIRTTSSQVQNLVEGQLGVVLQPILGAFMELVNRSVATPDQKREELESLANLMGSAREKPLLEHNFFWRMDILLRESEEPDGTRLRLLTQSPTTACEFLYAEEPDDSPVYFVVQAEEDSRVALQISFRDTTKKQEFYRRNQALLVGLFPGDVHPNARVSYLGRKYYPLDSVKPEGMAGTLLDLAGRLGPALREDGLLGKESSDERLWDKMITS